VSVNQTHSRRAVVSGGTQGLGAAITKAFLEREFEVTALYRANDAAAEEFVSSLSAAERNRIDLVRFDLTSGAPDLKISDSIEDLVVVHNASSGFQPFSIRSVETDAMAQLFLTNVVGAKNLLSATIKPLTRTKGTWISVLTRALKDYPKGFSHYVAAKAGLEAWTRAAEVELKANGIRFCCSYPGYMETQLTRDWPEILKSSQSPVAPSVVAQEIVELAATGY
jgi:NAD(P)-dependent dehydrogenase (short-subunit alcohol dehydrogenase family)